MSWWLDKTYRMIQTNFRDIDAAMDVDKWIESLKDFECNCVMVGAAGITAYYPSKLPIQYVSPYLQGRDTLGEIVAKCHEKDIRVIVRFDFSKVHESLERPENEDWFTITGEGKHYHFNDTVHTCLCGSYQREHSLEIIREVITNYPVDGIFFNYFGMHTKDYAGRDYGMCHCEGCKRLFREFSGYALPDAHSAPEVWKQYDAFKLAMSSDVMARVCKVVKAYSPDIAISTYHYTHVDLVRNESNSAPGYAYPINLYEFQSAENVAEIRTNCRGTKASANCVINAESMKHRFAGVPHQLTRIRLYEEMAQGGWLDFCIIGTFEGYPDREAYEDIREIFTFHKAHEAYFRKLESCAKVALVQSIHTTPVYGGSEANHGVFRLLKTAHIPFDVIGWEAIAQQPDMLDPYEAIIIVDESYARDVVIREARKRGIFILITDVTTPFAQATAKELGAQITQTLPEEVLTACYWSVPDKALFGRFASKDWIAQLGEYALMDAPGYEKMLPQISPALYAPPERAYGHTVTGVPGLLWNKEARIAIIPWPLMKRYYIHANMDCANLLLDVLEHGAPKARLIQTDAPAAVELFVDRSHGDTLVQLLNLTNYLGACVGDYIPVHDIHIRLPLLGKHAVKALSGAQAAVNCTGDAVELTIPVLSQYAAYALSSVE